MARYHGQEWDPSPAPKPDVKPLAAAVYVTYIPAGGSGGGSYQVFAADQPAPTTAGGAILNFRTDRTLGNSTNIPLCLPATCPTSPPADFGIKSNRQPSHVVVEVLGYYYPVETNLISVSPEGGDFTDPLGALNSIPTTGADAPSDTNRYLVKLGPGVYDIGNETLFMRDYVSVIGSGVAATRLQTANGISGSSAVVFHSVTGSDLAAMTVYNAGNNASFSTGVLVDTDSEDVSNPHLYDLRIVAEGGTQETKGIQVEAGTGSGSVAPVIERVDAVARNPVSGRAIGIFLLFCDSTRLERVNAFAVGADPGDAGLQIAATDCANPILWSQFSGPGGNDINANPAANAVTGHSHLVNGTISSGGGVGTVSCLSVTTPTAILDTDCTTP